MDPTRQIDDAIETLSNCLSGLARDIHDDPELSFEEHRAAARITALLREHAGQANIIKPFGGLNTAFRARLGDGSGPHVAILAEYDALPEIGHACGHNLIAAGAVGAWLALADLDDMPACTIDLIGTPAEEGGGGKIRLIEAGAFAGVDAALMFHPFDRDLLMHRALATCWLELTFVGQPTHASIAPGAGTSALTACMDTFRLIDGQRVHMPDEARVHGIITNGGAAVNIIPERAVCEFSVRAGVSADLPQLRAVIERCAQAAALASGVSVEIAARQGYLDMRNNGPLARHFGTHWAALGEPARESDTAVGAGSTDMGDVSYQVPSIHPWLAICDLGESTCHERKFAECARSQRGLQTMLRAAKSLARTAHQVVLNDDLRAAAWREFHALNS